MLETAGAKQKAQRQMQLHHGAFYLWHQLMFAWCFQILSSCLFNVFLP